MAKANKKYDKPTRAFPFKIAKRLNLLSVPRPTFTCSEEGKPAYNARGIRMSALGAPPSERVNEAAWPYLRLLLLTKRMYKHLFTPERLERLDHIIEMTNATTYSKLAGCVIDLKKSDKKDSKKETGWSESDWQKHMDYISQIATPKKDFMVEIPRRGQRRKLEQLLPRIKTMMWMPQHKLYRRPSQESNYRDPVKVPPKALTYVISERVKKLAKPRAIPTGD